MTEPAFEDIVPAADGTPLEFSEPDERWKQDFDGLLYIGELTASFEYLGHKIRIRTLRTAEELIVAELVKQWGDTIGGTKAYATALAALAVTDVDGRPMPTPLGEAGNSSQWAYDRFIFAQRWYPFTIDEIYTRYLELEARVREILDGLGKASTRAASPPGPPGTSASPSAGESSGEPPSP
jgi:hypothetical protein